MSFPFYEGAKVASIKLLSQLACYRLACLKHFPKGEPIYCDPMQLAWFPLVLQ